MRYSSPKLSSGFRDRLRGNLCKIPHLTSIAASGAGFSPSPGNPGEGRGEGDFECRKPLVLEITLIPAFSRTTGRKDR
jgi:hypothetical protein